MANDAEKEAGRDLRIFGADLVQHGPYAHLRRHWRQRQGRGAQEERYLGGQHRDDHLEDEGYADEAREQACHQERPARDLEAADEMSRSHGKGNADLGEAAHPLVRVDELEDALPEKDPAGHEAEEQNCGRTLGRRVRQPLPDALHAFSHRLEYSWEIRRGSTLFRQPFWTKLSARAVSVEESGEWEKTTAGDSSGTCSRTWTPPTTSRAGSPATTPMPTTWCKRRCSGRTASCRASARSRRARGCCRSSATRPSGSCGTSAAGKSCRTKTNLTRAPMPPNGSRRRRISCSCAQPSPP